MSYQYDQYLAKHKENVRNGFDWLQTNLPELVKDVPNLGWQTGFAHDQSKSEPDEYEAYDAYFYGGTAKELERLTVMVKMLMRRCIGSRNHRWENTNSK